MNLDFLSEWNKRGQEISAQIDQRNNNQFTSKKTRIGYYCVVLTVTTFAIVALVAFFGVVILACQGKPLAYMVFIAIASYIVMLLFVAALLSCLSRLRRHCQQPVN